MLFENLKSLALAGVMAMALAAPALADDADATDTDGIPGTLSGTLTLASDYVFRGISQTGEGPAIQGSFDYAYDLFYMGVWASNIDFASSIEMDWYAGLSGEFNGVTWDAGFTYYSYPGQPHNVGENYIEGYGYLGYDFGLASVTAGVAISPDFQFNSDMGYYPNANLNIPLGDTGFALDGTVGRQYIENNAAWGTPDYTDWSVGITYSIAGFDLDLRYRDTDLSAAECFAGADICDARVVFSGSRSF